MTFDEIKERLTELNPEALLADGFEEALIGIVRQFNRYLALYDYEKCIDVLLCRKKEKCSACSMDNNCYEQAVEHMEFNVVGAWMGENTPCFTVLLEKF